MTPRQARRERREAERKAKKLELKKARLAGTADHPVPAADVSTAAQPRWNPDLPGQPSCGLSTPESDSTEFAKPQRSAFAAARLEDELPPDLQIRANALAQRVSLRAQPPRQPNGFVSQNTPSRAETNRANAQRSTRPRSLEGKVASSGNSLKHGLASGQVIIPGEDVSAFEAFLNHLLDEHQPTTPTERLLIEEMAQSHWLTQRAIRLQNECFTAHGVNEKQLALFLRYQTTHQRAFYKAFNSLLRLKKEAARGQRGFVSQLRPEAHQFVRQNASPSGFVSQKASQSLPSPQFVRQNAPESHRNGGTEVKTKAA